MAWEGLRLFDLFRWRTAHILLKGRFHGMKICSKEKAPGYTKVPVNADGYYFCEETFLEKMSIIYGQFLRQNGINKKSDSEQWLLILTNMENVR